MPVGNSALFHSVFTHRLGTNYATTAHEARQIKAWAVDAQDEIESMANTIEEAERSLQVLKDKKRQLQDAVESHVALTSPIRQIHSEVLSQIFVFCSQDTRPRVMHASEAPLLLCRVCSYWRAIAFGTPQLWSSVHLAIPFRSPALSQLRLTAFTDWISRAGSLPLDLSLCDATHWESPFTQLDASERSASSSPLSNAIQLAWSHAHRLQNLRLAVSGPTLESYLPSLRVPSLTTLRIDVLNQRSYSNQIERLISQLPETMTSISLHGILDWTLPPNTSRLELLHLTFGSSVPTESIVVLLRTINQSTKLRECAISYEHVILDSLPETPDGPDIIFLPLLSSFILHAPLISSDDLAAPIFLDRLQCPQLKVLEVTTGDALPENQIEEYLASISHFLQRSRCPLEQLALDPGDRPELVRFFLTSCFVQAPNISRLLLLMRHFDGDRISSDDDTDDSNLVTERQAELESEAHSILLRAITSRNLLPNLKELTIWDPHTRWNLAAIKEFGLARAAAGLERVYFLREPLSRTRRATWREPTNVDVVDADLQAVFRTTELHILNPAPPDGEGEKSAWIGIDSSAMFDSLLKTFEYMLANESVQPTE